VNVADLVYALAWPPTWALLWTVIRRAWRLIPSWANAGYAWMCAGGGVVIGFILGPWPCVVIGAAHVAIGAWLWRRGRRGRRRAPRAYGAKSRALVAALVARARDASTPRPVLRPVPAR